jgi:hypothetical protein
MIKAAQWLAICTRATQLGATPPIRIWRVIDWYASRHNTDRPIGCGKTELEAVADLLEREAA